MSDSVWHGVVPQPRLEHVLTIRLELGGAHTTPVMSSGVQHGQVNVLSGTFHGPHLRGRALPLGGDSPVVLASGIAQLDARYFLEEDDGTVIRIHNRGIFRMAPEVRERVTRGDDVSPNDYYIRTSPTFEVPEGPHDWLCRYTFVGYGRRDDRGNEISYFRVL